MKQRIEEPSVPALAVIETLRCERRVGESLYETAERLITQEALYRSGGDQAKAARLIYAAKPTMNRKCANLRLRPKDRR